MRRDVRDEIAGLRAQIKAHRQHTKRMRLGLREINGRQIGRRDPIWAMRLRDAINNRMHAIRGCEYRIAAVAGVRGITVVTGVEDFVAKPYESEIERAEPVLRKVAA